MKREAERVERKREREKDVSRYTRIIKFVEG
jgi:hypothetical protein